MITWLNLRSLGRSPVIRSSFFWLFSVPLLARVLEQLESPLVWQAFGKSHEIALDLPFSWYLFYFAAVAFSVASGLFSLFCPQIIKDYPDFMSFYQSGKGAHALFDLMGQEASSSEALRAEISLAEDRRIKKAFPGNRENVDVEWDLNDPSCNVYHRMSRILREDLGDIFQFSVLFRSQENKPAAYLAALFYGVGFLLSLSVAIQSFWFVVMRFAGSQ